MSKDPAFLFYSSDFLTGTALMTDEQIGKYIKLLCYQHQKGHLTERDMLKICLTHDEDILSKFEKDENGLYYNARLQQEVEKRKAYSESRRQNRTKKDMNNISNSYVQHMENENENIIVSSNTIKNKDNSTQIENNLFLDFWAAYPVKTGKIHAEKIFNKLAAKVQQQIIDHVQEFAKHKPFPTYQHPNPTTYLNQKRYLDELPKIDKSANGNSPQSVWLIFDGSLIIEICDTEEQAKKSLANIKSQLPFSNYQIRFEANYQNERLKGFVC